MTLKHYDSQTAELLAVIGQNMPRLDRGTMQYWIQPENRKELQEKLAGALVREELHLQQEAILRFHATYDLPATKEYDFADFYQTRAGLFVGSSLHNLVLPHVIKAAAPAHKLASYHLAHSALDSHIRSELPGGHVLEFGECLARLASLIEAQWGGSEGPLLNNGYVNFLYMPVDIEVVAVNAYWGRDYLKWVVNAYPLGARHWNAGDCVFSRFAAASMTLCCDDIFHIEPDTL